MNTSPQKLRNSQALSLLRDPYLYKVLITRSHDFSTDIFISFSKGGGNNYEIDVGGSPLNNKRARIAMNFICLLD